MASGSWKTYKTAVDSLEIFRKIYKMNPIWPVPVGILAQFIAHLSYKGHIKVLRRPLFLPTFLD
jgi:TPP-dependent indolepyruvate ferredoxin oxidoreductase alpha subunit